MSLVQYPAVVSRTLDASGKSLRTIVGMHDRQITDADINEIQDLQDLKRSQVLDNMVASGNLTLSPMQFDPFSPTTFFIPAFDVLFNGQVVSILGNQSGDLNLNRVSLPAPAFWGSAADGEDARIYVVFLEIWYQALNPITGTGYNTNPLNPGVRYYYPYGGINPDPSNAFIAPDDSTDPFQGLFTTERAQIQWRINVQRVALDYNFSQFKFGLDPGNNVAQTVYAQASLATATPGVSPLNGVGAYQFNYMGNINGDSGLWRAGSPPWNNITTYGLEDRVVHQNITYRSTSAGNVGNIPTSGSPWQVTTIGNINNSLGTMDGYSYAMPLAVAFQRNTGNFDIVNNLFGCADPATPGSGTLQSRVSGRFDFKLADQVFADDVVDTRSVVELQGVDLDSTMRFGFGDLVTGNTSLAISRGESPGSRAEALGSTLEYNVAVSSTVIPNTSTVGQWDGFANGFSSDQRTFFSSLAISTAQKSTGTQNTNWVVNDSFTIVLPASSNGVISEVDVTALVSNTATGSKSAASLLQGQFQASGLGSKAVTITFIKNLSGTLFDPGPNNVYATVGVTYPAGSGVDLRKIPFALDGGTLFDQASGKNLPVFGISDYLSSINLTPLEALNIVVINPEYSDVILGTKVWITKPGSAATQQTVGGSTIATFILPMKGINGPIGGFYCTRAWDLASGSFYQISAQSMSSLPANAGIQTVVTLQTSGGLDPNSTVVFSIIAQDTVQLSYNAPVKGVTQIEETVVMGNYTLDANFPVDPRVNVESVSFDSVANTNTIVLGANGCVIKGISGDDVNRFIWVKDNAGNLNSVTIQSINANNGVVTIVVPGTVTLTGVGASSFVIVGSILPAFNSQSNLIVSLQYLPYQGEGVLNRDYEIIHTEDNALITTNGTGAAPIVGLADVYPYNRELPIITTLPAQSSWNDATLENTALASFFDSNFVAMRVNNVEHTFLAPLHTNDFIPPLNKDTRKTIRFITAGQRGFASAIPHLGFAIATPTVRTVLGQNLQSTVAPITLYVDNANGSDNNTGLSLLDAKATISAALNLLPPVLRHPCVIIIRDTGIPFSITALQNSMQTIALGDGDIRSTKVYALGNLSRVIQDEGRLVISREATATDTVIIDATGFSGFGDGPTCAFYMDTSRVILSGIQFRGFQNPSIIAYNGDIDFVDCVWTGNVQATSTIGCDSVIFDRGSLAVPDSGNGHISVQSNVTSSNHVLIASGASPGAFYTVTRGSSLNLEMHGTGTLDETNIVATTVVAEAQLNSSISVTSDFQSNGAAVLQANSVLSRTVSVTPFLGGVIADASSSVVTQV